MTRVLFVLLIAATPMAAQNVSRDEGLAAWERVYAVASHPRCTNCHVGAQEEPMWEGLSYGRGTAHGMGVKADESRIGAESMPCRTCHVTATGRETPAHAPAQIDDAWRLPPVELDWLGESSAALCAQLRDPERNDGHEIADLVDHLTRSPFVAWGFAPGGGRSAPPGSPVEMARDIALWGAAGAPCE
ncbi:MAG: hypothetical protein HKP51_09245 [Sulfitobacter sp.]|nr:hypothetical protein [Sulfitobacter sp.]